MHAPRRRPSPRPFRLEALEYRRLMSLPSGFAQTTFASGLTSPTSMAFAPDGRLFVTEQGGAVKVVSASGAALGTFVTVPARNIDEQGLLGVEFDPNYASNRYVYLHWITSSRNNRVTRYTADASNPNVAAAGSEAVVIDLPVNFGGNHQGGALHFGPDEKLYLAVGDHGDSSLAQSMSNPFGKMLRFNADGTIPTDNPFYGTASGINRAIWALGLRNPFTFNFQPGTGKLFINDVGSTLYEEVNQGEAGANFGWPTTEGTFSQSTYPSFTNPLHAYRRGDVGCAIAGGVFYNPPAGVSSPFPSAYTGKYLFGDYCSNFIHVLDPADNSVTTFATDGQLPAEAVDLDVGADGSVYALGRNGTVAKITYTGSDAPAISTDPQSRTITLGQPVTFGVSATGAAPLSYQWQRNGTNISGATSSTYTIAAVQASDNNAQFRCVVTNGSGSATSSAATLTVTSNQAPVATITAPTAGTTYGGGQTINFSGTGTDNEDGSLAGSAFTWSVVFHHATHTHPFVAPTSGQTSGSFVVPTVGEPAADVWYRVHLTVTDSQGLTHSTVRDVQPRTSSVTLATSPAGLSVDLDGAARTAPYTFTGVEGIVRTLGAPTTQTVGGVTYQFVSWSDGGARGHNIDTPVADTTYTATFSVVDTSRPVIGTQPQSQGVSVGQPATFTVSATGPGTLSYQWQRDGTNIPGATSSSYTLASAALSDSGAAFRCVVTNANGSTTSNAAALTVATGAVPVATITAPAAGGMYRAGDTINFSGTATDAEDGDLPAGAYTWEVVFHHADHTHSVVPTINGASGSFTVPTTGETAADVFYRIHLRVVDSDGLTHEVTRDVQPHTANVTLATNVAGLQLSLDGVPVTAPTTFLGVAGSTRVIGAPSSQTVEGVVYDFVSWSDAGPAEHAISTPDAAATYTAVYQARQPADPRYDLIPTVAGVLPAEVVGGNRGNATVLLANGGTEMLSGFVTVKVFVSSDTVLDGADAQAGVVTRRVRMRPNAPRPLMLRLRLKYPALPDGSYHLLAQADPDNAIGEASESNNVSASAATILNHAPFVELSGAMLPTPTTLTRGRRSSVAVSVLNGGNVFATGPLTLNLYAAQDPAGTTGRTLLATLPARPVKIRAGGRKAFRFAFVPPADLPAGAYYYTAEIDAAGGFAEPDEANNVAVAPGSFTIE